MRRSRLLRSFLFPVLGAITATGALMPVIAATLSVSDDGRYLVTPDGEPFFWLGDTAWELFHRLTHDEAIAYLDDRAARGFTIIQAVALAEKDGLNAPTPAGYLPLENNDPATPLIVDGPDNDYWDHVDRVIDAANERGLIVALLPTWGDKWNLAWGPGPVVFTPENARIYGEWIGTRYRDKEVIWVLGGDRNPETEEHLAITDAMADGIEAAAGKDALITFHPQGGTGSAQWFHDRDWLDFNMRQNGHQTDYRHYTGTIADRNREPAKPLVEGEPLYEGIPIQFDAEANGYAMALDVRRPLYWNLFNGAAGHTYGHNSIWQMFDERYPPTLDPLMSWREALEATGGDDMRHAKSLLTSRPGWEKRVAAPEILIERNGGKSVPGGAAQRIVATRAADGSWAMVYVAVSRPVSIIADAVGGDTMNAWLFDPRTGAAQSLGQLATSEEFLFTPPNGGEQVDWVLVLDTAGAAFPAPGQDR
ncbi:DUF4038 domain-containing protein [Parvularcula flava]|uniref:DUF4038 domain-containing protein n=1 Tax=Aquisalinus luteolus TaxID=1566827 RepID=A0A8J3A664_9PROT|nr:DUF4038 domain-containing protein [Aquisalinus luteolus]NHK29444.1 DUF4038 domain-containing protein [Aquisalinus luteolus]GGI01928.1 hypothetical protein GCM10011355_33720 [Aquisalinus luteolus]